MARSRCRNGRLGCALTSSLHDGERARRRVECRGAVALGQVVVRQLGERVGFEPAQIGRCCPTARAGAAAPPRARECCARDRPACRAGCETRAPGRRQVDRPSRSRRSAHCSRARAALVPPAIASRRAPASTSSEPAADQASLSARRCWRTSSESKSSFGMPRIAAAKSAASSLNLASRGAAPAR